MGDYPAALSDLDRAIELDIQDDWNRYKRGQVHLAMGHSDLADHDFAGAIESATLEHEKEPTNWRNTLNLAVYHPAAGNTGESQGLYEKAFDAPAPTALLQEASNDVEGLLGRFPDHGQTQEVLIPLFTRLA